MCSLLGPQSTRREFLVMILYVLYNFALLALSDTLICVGQFPLALLPMTTLHTVFLALDAQPAGSSSSLLRESDGIVLLVSLAKYSFHCTGVTPTGKMRGLSLFCLTERGARGVNNNIRDWS